MNQEIFIQILRQIVIDSAYSDKGLQLNSFYFADNDPQLEDSAFGATHEDFVSGRFWSRQWVLNGADPNKIAGQYPLIIVETRDYDIECIGGREEVDEYYILIVDEIGCVGCPDEDQRNRAQVKSNVRQMLASYLMELSTYTKHEITDGEDITTAWLAPGRAENMIQNGDDVIPLEDILSVVSADTVKVSEWGNHPKRIAYYAKLKTFFCRTEHLDFDYNNPSPGITGIIKCDC